MQSIVYVVFGKLVPTDSFGANRSVPNSIILNDLRREKSVGTVGTGHVCIGEKS